MIRFEQVRKVFAAGEQDVVAVEELSLEVQTGELLCLIGTSGSGKTTLLRMVNRLVEPSGGRVLVGGEDAAMLDPIPLRRRIGYVIQQGGLFPHLSVLRNVSLLCEVEGWPRQRARMRAEELLDLVGLAPDDFGNRYPRELSGGQRQRVGVARALALEPEILLMDEPFGALDPLTRQSLHDEFLQLRRHLAQTILLVTHDLEEAFALGDRVAILDGGRLLQVGSPEELRQRPATAFVRSFVEGNATQATTSAAEFPSGEPAHRAEQGDDAIEGRGHRG